MEILELIYTNPEFGTMINFNVTIPVGYDKTLKQYGSSGHSGRLLKQAKEVIAEFGRKIDFPQVLIEHMDDAELSYALALIETDVDAFIDGYVFVRVPAAHALTLVEIEDKSRVWRVNGTGLSALLLARLSVSGVSVSVVPLEKVSSDYLFFDPETSLQKIISKNVQPAK